MHHKKPSPHKFGLTVTERDFRIEEYRDALPEDYEYREDGRLVRKDRWMQGIFSIQLAVFGQNRKFEIPDLIEKVKELVEKEKYWWSVEVQPNTPFRLAQALPPIEEGLTDPYTTYRNLLTRNLSIKQAEDFQKELDTFYLDLKLSNGSVLNGVWYHLTNRLWYFKDGGVICHTLTDLTAEARIHRCPKKEEPTEN